MATHVPRVPGHAQPNQPYGSYDPEEQVQLPTRSNIGFIAGMIFAMGAIMVLLVYYVL